MAVTVKRHENTQPMIRFGDHVVLNNAKPVAGIVFRVVPGASTPELYQSSLFGWSAEEVERERVRIHRELDLLLASTTGLPLYYAQIMQLMDDATGKYLSSDGNTFTFENAPSTKTLFKLKPSKKRREQGIEHSESGLIVFNEDTVELLHFQTQHGVDGIKIEHNATGEFANRTRLQSGDCIRIFHAGAGYLHAAKRSKYVYFKSHRNETSDCTSYNSVWVMEAVGSGKFTFRLRLYGSDLYLRQVDQTEPGLPNNAICLSLGPKADDASTVFTMTMQDPNRPFYFGAVVSIQSVSGYEWRVLDAPSGHHEERHESRVYCIPTKGGRTNPPDYFSLHMVPPYLLIDAEKLKKPLATISSYQTGADRNKLVKAMKKVCKLLQPKPTHHQQNLLGASAVMRSLATIITSTDDVEVLKLSVTIAKAAAHANSKNGTRLANRLKQNKLASRVLEHPELYKQVDLAPMLYDAFHNNRELIVRLTIEDISDLFTMLFATNDVRFYKTISAVCHAEGSTILHIQYLVVEALLTKLDKLPRFRYNSGVAEVKFSEEQSFVKIADVVKDSTKAALLSGVINLFADVSAGRNGSAKRLTAIQSGVVPDYHVCFTLMKDKSLPYELRSAAAKLLWCAYVDVHPQNSRRTAFKRNWVLNSFKPYVLESCLTEVVKYDNPQNLNEFLLDFFFDDSNFKFGEKQVEKGQVQFALQIMKMVKGNFYFGAFRPKEILFPPRLAEILAIRRDAVVDKAHHIVTAIKHEALDILQRYLDIHDNTILAREFAKLTGKESHNKTTLASKWEQSFSESAINVQNIEKLCIALINTARGFNEGPLASRALRLLKRLVRSKSQSAAMLEALSRSHVVSASDAELPIKFTSIINEIYTSEYGKVARSRETSAQLALNAIKGSERGSLIFVNEDGVTDLLNLINITAIDPHALKASIALANLALKVAEDEPAVVAPFAHKLAIVAYAAYEMEVKLAITKVISTIFTTRPGLAHRYLKKETLALIVLNITRCDAQTAKSLTEILATMIQYVMPRIKATILAIMSHNNMAQELIDIIKPIAASSPPEEIIKRKKSPKLKEASAMVYRVISQLIMEQVVLNNDMECLWCIVAPLTWSHNLRSLMGVWKLLQACSETAVEMDAVDLLRNALSTLDAAHYISFWAQSFDAKVAIRSFDALQAFIDTSKESAEMLSMKLLASDSHFWDKAFELLERSYKALLRRDDVDYASYGVKGVATFIAVFAKSRKTLGESGHYFLPAMSGRFVRKFISFLLMEKVDPAVAAAVFFALDGLIYLQPRIQQKAIESGLYTAVNRLLTLKLPDTISPALLSRSSRRSLDAGPRTPSRRSLDESRPGDRRPGEIRRTTSFEDFKSVDRQSIERRRSFEIERRNSVDYSVETGQRVSLDIARPTQEFVRDTEPSRAVIRVKLAILNCLASLPELSIAADGNANEAVLFDSLNHCLKLLDQTPQGLTAIAVELAAGVLKVMRQLPPNTAHAELVKMVEHKVVSCAFFMAQHDEAVGEVIQSTLLNEYCALAQEKSSEPIGKSATLKRRGFDDNTKLWQYWHYKKLSNINLARNNFTRSASLVVFSNATVLNLKCNKLKEIAFLADLPFVKSLNLSNNHITYLPASLSWPVLEDLDISDNYLKAVDPLVSVKSLVRLNLSNNRNLKYLPAALHELHRLKELDLTQTPLITPPKQIAKHGLEAVMAFLRNMKDKVKWDVAKIAIVGLEGCGKTSLVKRLLESSTTPSSTIAAASASTQQRVTKETPAPQKPAVRRGQLTSDALGGPTEGINVDALTLRVGNRDISYLLYDFAGREEYYVNHTFFLTGKPLYVICYDVTNVQPERLEYWFRTLQWIAGSSAHLILVGTHTDLLKDEKELESVKLKLEPLFKFIRPDASVFVSTKTKKGLQTLREAITTLSTAMPILKADVPRTFELACHVVTAQRAQHCYISWDGFKALLADHIKADDQALRALTSFLHDIGIVVWFDDPAISDLVVLDPQWWSELMATFVNGRIKSSNGIVTRSALVQAWPNIKDMQARVIALLERFEIMFKLKEKSDHYVVPMVMDPQPSGEFKELAEKMKRPKHKKHKRIVREFDFEFVPKGFFPRVLCRIMQAASAKYLGGWKHGLMIEELSSSSSHKERLLVEYLLEDHKLMVTALQPLAWKSKLDGQDLFTVAIRAIESILRSSYASSAKLTRYAHCAHCLASTQTASNPGRFGLSEIQLAIGDGLVTLPCPIDKKTVVPLCDMVPDVYFENLPVIYEFTLGEALGRGSLGMAYRGKIYRPVRDVVVKEVVVSSEAEEKAATGAFRPFSHELAILSQLHHPNLVKLYGITLNPLRTVVEYCSGDTVRSIIVKSPEKLTWKLRYKICHQVVRAMTYLHSVSPPVLHRDLRSANVFIDDMSSDDIRVKVGDYGLVQHCVLNAAETLGAWRWLAPEVFHDATNMDQKTDVYSFAMFLFELASLQLPFSEFSDYVKKETLSITAEMLEEDPALEDLRNAGWEISPDGKTATREQVKVKALQNAIAKGLRPTIPSDCPAVIASIMKACWQPDPMQRPSFEALLSQLETVLIKEGILEKGSTGAKKFAHKLKFSELGTSTRALTSKELAKYRAQALEEFKKYDKEGSGVMSYEVMKSLLRVLCKYASLPRPTRQDVIDAFGTLDTDGDALISFEDFFSWWQLRLSAK